jgi:hypothetical protein
LFYPAALHKERTIYSYDEYTGKCSEIGRLDFSGELLVRFCGRDLLLEGAKLPVDLGQVAVLFLLRGEAGDCWSVLAGLYLCADVQPALAGTKLISEDLYQQGKLRFA